MFRFTVSMIALVPATLAAQVAGSGNASARASVGADAQIGKSAHVGATSSTSVEAEVAAARKRGLPEHPIRRRAAEGRAKGASEAQIALAAQRVRVNLESAHEAMVKAGRAEPSEQEVERGAAVLERGYTRANIEAIVRSAPADRSLVVAFDVLTKLSARGISTARAVAQVQSKLESRAPDTAIAALVGARANLGLTAPGAAAGGSAVAGTASSVGGGAASAAGAVTGVVKIKP